MITPEQLEALKFPVGQFSFPEDTKEVNPQWIETIGGLPTKLNEALEGLTQTQLNWRYRPEGWTVLQVVHHLVDSHLNAFMRVKRALTEDNPTISPYAQSPCVEMADSSLELLPDSVMILTGLHHKWATLLSSLDQEQWHRTFHHPEWNRDFNLVEATALYHWHCRTHLAHIAQAVQSQGKYND